MLEVFGVDVETWQPFVCSCLHACANVVEVFMYEHVAYIAYIVDIMGGMCVFSTCVQIAAAAANGATEHGAQSANACYFLSLSLNG